MNPVQAALLPFPASSSPPIQGSCFPAAHDSGRTTCMPPFGEQVSGHLLVLSSLGSVSPAFGCILHVVCSITTSSQTWHMMPQLYLPLPPSLLLPFWLFYFFLLLSCTFFFSCSASPFCSGSPRGDLPQPSQASARSSPRHRWVSSAVFLPLGLDSSVSQ